MLDSSFLTAVDVQIKELEQLVKDEIIQRKEEGYEIAEIEDRFIKTKEKTVSELEEFLKVLEKSTPKSDFPYKEPSNLEEIKAERPRELEKFKITLSDDELNDKIHGGWLGRCAGCLLGKPVEGLNKGQIEEWLKNVSAYPLKHYFPPLTDLPKEAPEWLKKRASRLTVLSGHITRMARDDDIDYVIMGLHILEKYGVDFTTMNVGESWLYLFPYWQIYTAERVAYRNLVNGILPPKSATYINPYREWIGAQIRADMWGYVAPGMPNLAAEFAYRDASLSHVKNGIYGEMFVSAMISAAFATNNIEKIIETGLSVIPKKSRLTEAAKDVLAWSKESKDWKDTWNKINQKYGHYHFVHTINNAAIVVMGLLHGKGDYPKSISISVMGGFDTDCNGATTGSILGVMLGAKALPRKWVKPLNDTVESFVIGYNNSQISDLAKHTFTIAKRSLGK
jgi:ADP-ribosylglycohydrolase